MKVWIYHGWMTCYCHLELRLFRDRRTMLPTNTNVKSGQANGTQALFQKLVLKQGTNLGSVILSNGIKVNAVFSSDVDHIVLKHVNNRIRPEIFSLQPKEFTFKAKFLKPKVLQTKGDEREFLIMKGKQIPLIINDATTGHKLQGSGVNNLFVHSWS